jgi:hypothetical protein
MRESGYVYNMDMYIVLVTAIIQAICFTNDYSTGVKVDKCFTYVFAYMRRLKLRALKLLVYVWTGPRMNISLTLMYVSTMLQFLSI